MTDKLPDVLQGLVAAERAAPVMTEAARAAVQTKLGATLGIANMTAATATTSTATTTTTTATATTTSTATATTAATATATTAATTTAGAVKLGTILKLVTVVAAIGGATTAAISTSRSSAPRVTAPVITEAATPVERMPTPAPVYEVAPDAPVVIEEPAAAAAPPAAAPKAAAKPAPAPEVPAQAVLLADASRAFASGDARRALQILDEDARHRTGGPLAEERDALRVSVLVELGRLDEARQHARELLARYPQSIHRPLVERVLTKDSP